MHCGPESDMQNERMQLTGDLVADKLRQAALTPLVTLWDHTHWVV
jgi:hypothetical protein